MSDKYVINMVYHELLHINMYLYVIIHTEYIYVTYGLHMRNISITYEYHMDYIFIYMYLLCNYIQNTYTLHMPGIRSGHDVNVSSSCRDDFQHVVRPSHEHSAISLTICDRHCIA